uniref:Exodeoxyribonuclease 7 small subunit n=1 Tax=Candidatus Berkiella aquae TaxID=295108 RepID=A0A0Q9YMG3_9GAMM
MTQTLVYDKFLVLIEKINLVANKKSNPTPVPDFEGSIQKLESIVNKMETGELSLEDALTHFEQGIALAKQCQQALKEAEQRVQQLMSENEPD